MSQDQIGKVKKILDKRYSSYKELLAPQQGTAEEICQLFEPKPVVGIACPFCGDGSDYDLIGLKYHLRNYCEVYQNTEVLF